MSDHLPECERFKPCDTAGYHDHTWRGDCVVTCICGQLRACEQRVRDEDAILCRQIAEVAIANAQAEALTKAHNAVAAAHERDSEDGGCCGLPYCCDHAVAAVDTLLNTEENL